MRKMALASVWEMTKKKRQFWVQVSIPELLLSSRQEQMVAWPRVVVIGKEGDRAVI